MVFSSIKLEEVPGILRSILQYLKSAPGSDFLLKTKSEAFKGSPLTLSPEGIKSFKKHIPEEIYQAGVAGYDDLNVTYVIGKILNRAILLLESQIVGSPYSSQGEKLKRDFSEIWGGSVSERSLIMRYKNESLENLIEKLTQSIDFLQDKIIPLSKKNH
jgi:hypothetical protein